MDTYCTISISENRLIFILGGLDYKVFVPGLLAEIESPYKKFGECNAWELLNLRIDNICNLTDNVVNHIVKNTPSPGKSNEEAKADIKAKVDAALEVCFLISIINILMLCKAIMFS